MAAPAMPLGNLLNGTMSGSYSSVPASWGGNADVFMGAGSLGALGGFHVIGVVGGVGGAQGEWGRLVLWDPYGTFTLQVAGKPSTGPLHYSSVSGTGAFTHATASGEVVLTGLSSAHASGAVSVTIEPTPPPPPPIFSAATTGIQVTIDLGPTRPSVQPGQTDTAPFVGAQVQIQPAGGGPFVAEGTTDAAGSFSVNLAPGTYLVVPMSPALYPSGAVPAPQLITVVANQMASVTFIYDTGMR